MINTKLTTWNQHSEFDLQFVDHRLMEMFPKGLRKLWRQLPTCLQINVNKFNIIITSTFYIDLPIDLFHCSFLSTSGARYACVPRMKKVTKPRNQNICKKVNLPTILWRKDFSPTILAKPKSPSLTWGNSQNAESKTFSGFKSQWHIFFECK